MFSYRSIFEETHEDCLFRIRRIGNTIAEIKIVSKSRGILATVNTPSRDIAKDEIAVKNYSENENMVEEMQKIGLLGDYVKDVQPLHAWIPVYKLNMEVLIKYAENGSK